jgi:arabinose-5-phosphate isomerase
VVICLSNSGETAELGDIIHYCKRFSIPLVALVRRHGSLLVETATVAVVLPEVPEASPTGAPTTSSTMMLAYSDALAIALLEKRGFTRDDFGNFHPGGKLGQALLRAESLMHGVEELPLVAKDAPMSDVLLSMTSKHFGCAGVTEDGRLAGIITDGDLRRHMSGDLMQGTAEQIMSRNPVTIRPQTLAGEALGIMNQKNITCLFVVDDSGKAVGIVHIHDCLRAGIR